VRRDGKPVKPASRRIPDTNLCFVARPEDRVKKQFFVQQTFGEELEQIDRDISHDSIAPPISSWVKQGDATLEERDGVAVLSLHTSKDGLTIPLSGKSGEVYSA